MRQLLAEQVEAWNRGDLDSFVLAYAEDSAVRLDLGNDRGRSEVLARYKRRYADVKAMGRLTLDVEELRVGAGGATPSARRAGVAKWTLEREGSPPRSGPTLLFLERRDGRWWITEDASMEHEPAG